MSRSQRRTNWIDLCAKSLSVGPAAWNRRVDQVRRDLHMLSDGLRGRSPSTHAQTEFTAPDLRDVSALEALLPGPVARAMQGLLRDGSSLAKNAAGQKSPSVIAREGKRPSRHRPATNEATAQSTKVTAVAEGPDLLHHRRMRVSRLVRETADAVTIYLQQIEGELVDFDPGQFLTVEVTVDGQPLRRAYSLCTSPLEDQQAITVKRVAGGRVSNHLNDHLKEGDELLILGPSGHFTVRPAPASHRRVMLVAGGSGITPIFSILKSVLQIERNSELVLFYGNRSRQDIIFADALSELEAKYGPRLRVVHTLESTSDDFNASHGRLDQTQLEALVRNHVDDPSAWTMYACGPEPVRQAARAVAQSLGLEDDAFHEEVFVRPSLTDNAPSTATGPVTATMRTSQGTKRLVVQPGETLLDAGLAAGLPMPFSCAMGGCGACRQKKVGGEVHMEEPNCLTSKEREQGYVLACICHPVTDAEFEVSYE